MIHEKDELSPLDYLLAPLPFIVGLTGLIVGLYVVPALAYQRMLKNEKSYQEAKYKLFGKGGYVDKDNDDKFSCDEKIEFWERAGLVKRGLHFSCYSICNESLKELEESRFRFSEDYNRAKKDIVPYYPKLGSGYVDSLEKAVKSYESKIPFDQFEFCTKKPMNLGRFNWF